MKILDVSRKWTVEGYFRWRDGDGRRIRMPDWEHLEGNDDRFEIEPIPVAVRALPYWTNSTGPAELEDGRWREWVGSTILPLVLSRKEAVNRARERARDKAIEVLTEDYDDYDAL